MESSKTWNHYVQAVFPRSNHRLTVGSFHLISSNLYKKICSSIFNVFKHVYNDWCEILHSYIKYFSIYIFLRKTNHTKLITAVVYVALFVSGQRFTSVTSQKLHKDFSYLVFYLMQMCLMSSHILHVLVTSDFCAGVIYSIQPLVTPR